MTFPRGSIRPADLILASELDQERVWEFLAGKRFQDPERADRALTDLAELSPDRGPLAELLPSLLEHLSESPNPDGALIAFQGFVERSGNSSSLYAFLKEDGAALEILVTIFSRSAFLIQLLQRNPEYLSWLTSGERLNRILRREDFDRQNRQALARSSDKLYLDSLRRIRRREYLRIAAQDLLGLIPLEGVQSQLSELAESILQAVLSRFFPGFAEGQDQFSVIAVGKLGGGELNYSSDIDLIYLYSDGSGRERMIRLAKAFTTALNEHTGEGRLYRVDLRLRPFGRTGEIAYPLRAYRSYYELEADTLERFALIKSRPVAGDPELGEQFQSLTRPFVYRKYLDKAALEEIRWLKHRSERPLERRGVLDRDVKLGPGGIREVEFLVQAFQMLYGGNQRQLREASTLEALKAVVDAGVLPLADYQLLGEAYRFFRTVEHRLQLQEDLQTQTLPEDRGRLKVLAEGLGFVSAEGFRERLDGLRRQVHRLFQSLFDEMGEPAETGVRRLALAPRLDPQVARRLLEQTGVERWREAFEGIEQLRRASAYPQSAARMRNLLANLFPLLVARSARVSSPGQLLGRFDRLAESVGARGEFYRGLIEDPTLAQRLLLLLSLGDSLAETLIQHPELLDSISRPELPPPSAEGLLASLETRNAPDALQLGRALYKRREEFKIAVQELPLAARHLPLDPLAARRSLSDLADFILAHAAAHLLSEIPALASSRFSLLALGKLGGRELTYHSDLDLVLLYDDAGASPSEFNRFILQLKSRMEEYTSEGVAYRVDLRLRPEGRKSSPATPIKTAAAYFTQRAEPWERLVYVKAREVFALNGGVEWTSLLQPLSWSAEELQSLAHIRYRKEREQGKEGEDGLDLKVGRGALMDVQFLIQEAQLRHGIFRPGSWEALEQLEQAGALPSPDCAVLREALLLIVRLESALRLLSERPATRLPLQDEKKLGLLSEMTAIESGVKVVEHYRAVTESVRGLFESHFGR